MFLAIALLGLGAALVHSAFLGVSLAEYLQGDWGKLKPQGGRGGSGGVNQSPGSDAAQSGNVGNTPKDVIDNLVIPVARGLGFNVTAASIAAANSRHGPTITGGRSDHQGPPELAWAGDFSNGSSPTPEMDQLAAELARMFGLQWDGSGSVTGNFQGYRVQLIYRSMVGGNHFNHVHIGIRKA